LFVSNQGVESILTQCNLNILFLSIWPLCFEVQTGAPAPQSTRNAAVPAGVESLVWPAVMLESSVQSAPSSQSIPFHQHTPVSLSIFSSPSPVKIFKQ
jgi:hypothetical protein